MLHEDFETLLTPLDEHHRERINKMNKDRRGNALYTEKKNTYT